MARTDVSRGSKEEAAGQECQNGDERLQPSVGMSDGLSGGPQCEEDRVPRLHGDEASPGIVNAAIAESGDETACKNWNVGVVWTDLGPQVSGYAVPCALFRCIGVAL